MSAHTSLRTLIVDDENNQAQRETVVGETVAPARFAVANASAKQTSTMKLSINVAEDLGARLRRLAFDLRVSESSIVEVALGILYETGEDTEIAEILRSRGASLRRKRQ
jgi:hypothetical protein